MKTTDMPNPVDLLDQASDTYFKAMKDGLKMQKQFTESCLGNIKEASGKQDWATRMQESAEKVGAQAKDSAEETMRMMEKGTKDTMALLNKAVEIGGVATPGEAQVKIQQLWQESLNVLNNNAKEMVQANSKMLQAWAEMAKENVEQASKAATKAKK